ncbi:sensor histidine kinase [Hyphococcus sp.]|uniref:sensor histidine kinase n=2 Tax=Hyphococcus sp. TaxID=2038636 RepID=UPI0035C698FB
MAKPDPIKLAIASAIAAPVLLAGTAGAELAGAASLGAAIFYASAITIIAAFFLINIALKNRPGVYYAILFALMLLLLWALEGGLSLAAPEMSAAMERKMALSIGFLAAGFGFFTAESSIDPRRRMLVVRRILLVLAAASAVLAAGAWLAPQGVAAMLANMFLVAMFASHIVSTLTWKSIDGRSKKAPVLLAGALLMMALGVWFVYGSAESTITAKDLALRVLFAAVAAPTMGVIFLGLVEIRRAHDQALKDALTAARKDAEMSAALLEMEKNYSRARDIAANRSRQLSSASHDIRQPIASLRAELDVLKRGAAATDMARLDRILDHLSALTAELGRSADTDIESEPAPEQAERVPAEHFFKMLERMFGAEAKAKSITLGFTGETHVFHVPAVALMRIGANLVSNAIQHSGAANVHIAAEADGDGIRLTIADDGAGFPEEEKAQAFEAGVKGSDSDGSGLGLSIVHKLAQMHGLDLTFHSETGRGSRFTLLIPAAR